MILYKYLEPDRVDILQMRRIRFTQPRALNDPHEAVLKFGRLRDYSRLLATAPVVRRTVAQMRDNLWARYQHDLDALFAFVADVLGKDSVIASMDSVIRYELATAVGEALPAERESRVEDWLQDWLRKNSSELGSKVAWRLALEWSMRVVADRFAAIMKDVAAIDDTIGVLCLSSRWDSFPMWVHYAMRHRGFVLGFDGSHEFFKHGPFEGSAGPEKVLYVEDLVEVDPLDFCAEARNRYFRKHSSWSYECEWRALKILADATSVLDLSGALIYLFEFPPESLRVIVLGAFISDDTSERIRAVIELGGLEHVEVYAGVVSNDSYAIEKSPVSPWNERIP